MNRKQTSPLKINLLKWHALIYAAAMFTVWYGMVATINASGNQLISLDSYRPLILERIDFTLLWGVLLVAHLGMQQIQEYRQQQHPAPAADSGVTEGDTQQMQFM